MTVLSAMASSSESLRLVTRLATYRETIRQSKLLEQTVSFLENEPISKIRCLALGSPTDSNAALYQLAYVLETAGKLNVPHNCISHYDPVFSEEDRVFLVSLDTIVEQKYSDKESSTTLYFLPHAGLDLTNTIISTYQPRFLLANNLVTHTDRISTLKLHVEYPQLSLLSHLVSSTELKLKLKQEPEETQKEDFITVSRKQKRNRKKGNKLFLPPKIEYDYSEAYFNSIEIKPLQNLEGPWINAFTDLTLHIIHGKEDNPE